MLLSDFDYSLPRELIAQFPLEERSASRLLCLNRSRDLIQHSHFSKLPDWLKPGDFLVFNNSKVIPARLFGVKETGGKVEILVERILSDSNVLAHIRGLSKGKVIQLGEKACAIVTGRIENLYELEFNIPVLELLQQQGHMPLPPYIDRADETSDQERYQTIYAKLPGSVAAPTAGLHFDQLLLDKLKEKHIQLAYVTLHVGAGTFQPVKTQNIKEHQMHTELFELPSETCDKIKEAQANGGRVIAVGTTSARCLENLKSGHGETNIFIYPGYQFKVIDGLITNFHLPKSTLLMLVSAFAGRENILNAYQCAIQEKYRFFSYGDGMLII